MQESSISFAFKNWGAQLGLLLSAVSIFSFLARALSVSPAEPIEVLLGAFRATFHPVVDLPLSLFDITVAPLTKDLTLLYLAFGGAVGRTLIAVFETNRSREFFVATRVGQLLNATVRSPVLRLVAVFLCLFVWPMVLLFGLQWPLVVRRDGMTTLIPPIPKRLRGSLAPGAVVVCDLRVVLGVQLVTVVLAAAALTIAAVVSGP